MVMWGMIFLVFLLLFIASIIYLITRIRKFSFIKNIENKKREYLLSSISLLFVSILLGLMIDTVNLVIILLHLAFTFIICDLICYIVSKKRALKTDKYYSGLVAIVVTVVYLSSGWYLAHHVFEKTYDIETEKNVNGLRIVQITDSHVGTTFDGDGFIERVEKINEIKPDLVLLTGDFVDDGTSKEDMIKSCYAISKIHSKYGTYFIFGNHDKGYYSNKSFTEQELESELEKYDIHIIEDEVATVNDNIVIIGRADYSIVPNRKTMKELMNNVDSSKYVIVLDHEPTDYDNEAKEKIDLVLSGHTHGGQMIPIGFISEKIMKVNDRTYGIENRNGTNFIVSSGISDWAFKFKTGTKSEYVVININK